VIHSPDIHMNEVLNTKCIILTHDQSTVTPSTTYIHMIKITITPSTSYIYINNWQIYEDKGQILYVLQTIHIEHKVRQPSSYRPFIVYKRSDKQYIYESD
jgi:hypothetical protein